MEVVMKNLLIALVILSSLVSCGKKNTVGGTVSSTSPMVASTPIETDFINKVNGNQFGTGRVNAYETFTQAIAKGYNPKFQYANYAAPQVVQPDCHTAWIFRVCSSSSTSGGFQAVTVAREVSNSSITVAAAQAKIVEIYSRKSQVEVNGTLFRIRTTDNKTYYFETSLPIQANPTQSYNADGSGEWMFNVL